MLNTRKRNKSSHKFKNKMANGQNYQRIKNWPKMPIIACGPKMVRLGLTLLVSICWGLIFKSACMCSRTHSLFNKSTE